MSAWGAASGGTSAWASQVEEEEEERKTAPPPAEAPKILAGQRVEEAFPTLGAAAKVEPKKKQKQKLSLSEFVSGGGGGGAGAKYEGPSRAARPIDVLSLPTGPRVRDEAEEAALAAGGGFGGFGARGDRSPPRYGDRDRYGDRGAAGGDRDRERGGFGDRDRERGGDRDRDEPMGPSRADEDDNWGKSKKAAGPPPPPPRRAGDGPPASGGFADRYGPDRGGDRGGDRDRPGGFGGDRYADRDGGRDREGGFRDGPADLGPSRADEARDWKAAKSTGPPASGGGGGGGGGSPPRGERPRLALAPRSAAAPAASSGESDAKPSPFGAAKPVAVKEMDKVAGGAGEEEKDAAPRGPKPSPFGGARPVEVKLPPAVAADASAARPEPPAREPREPRAEAVSSSSEPKERPKLNLLPPGQTRDAAAVSAAAAAAAGKPNPFGGAKPREVKLMEQGRDYRKEEVALSRKARAETADEKALRLRIEALRARVEAGEGEVTYSEPPAAAPPPPAEGEPAPPAAKPRGPRSVQQAVADLESDLETLTLANDDKIRFGHGGDGPKGWRAPGADGGAAPGRKEADKPAA